MKKRYQTAAFVMIGIGILFLAVLLLGDKYSQEAARKNIEKDAERTDVLYAEKAALEEKENALKEELKGKEFGKPYVLIMTDTIDAGLYEIVYPRMKEKGYSGTLLLKDGKGPGSSKQDVTKEQFEEILQAGWDYAIGITTQEKERTEEAWSKKLNQAVSKWKDNGIEIPSVFACLESGYEDWMEPRLKELGIKTVVEIKDDAVAYIKEYESDYMKVDSVRVKEKVENLNQIMNTAYKERATVGMMFSQVKEKVSDKEHETSVEKFNRCLGQIAEMEFGGYSIDAYGKYHDYRASLNAEYQQKKEELDKFVQEKEEKIKEIEEFEKKRYKK